MFSCKPSKAVKISKNQNVDTPETGNTNKELARKEQFEKNTKKQRQTEILAGKTARKEKAKLEREKKDERKTRREARTKSVNSIPGLQHDILKLKKVFQMSGKHDWKGFQEAVIQTHFNLLYSGIAHYHEFIQFTEKVFRFCLPRWLEARTFSDAMFGFFVLSTVYYLQPVEHAVKIRIGMENLAKIAKFKLTCESTKNLQAEFILIKMLLVDQCFNITENPRQLGLLHTKKSADNPLREPLPSSIVTLSYKFDKLLDKYKLIRDTLYEKDSNLYHSGHNLNYSFVSEFIDSPSTSLKDDEEMPLKDDIGQRRKALKQKAFSSFSKSPRKSQQDKSPSDKKVGKDDDNGSSDDSNEEWLVTLDRSELPCEECNDDADDKPERESKPSRNPQLKKFFNMPVIKNTKPSGKKHSVSYSDDDSYLEESDISDSDEGDDVSSLLGDINEDRRSADKTKEMVSTENISSPLDSETLSQSEQNTPAGKSGQSLTQKSMPAISPEETHPMPKENNQKAASRNLLPLLSERKEKDSASSSSDTSIPISPATNDGDSLNEKHAESG